MLYVTLRDPAPTEPLFLPSFHTDLHRELSMEKDGDLGIAQHLSMRPLISLTD